MLKVMFPFLKEFRASVIKDRDNVCGTEAFPLGPGLTLGSLARVALKMNFLTLPGPRSRKRNCDPPQSLDNVTEESVGLFVYLVKPSFGRTQHKASVWGERIYFLAFVFSCLGLILFCLPLSFLGKHLCFPLMFLSFPSSLKGGGSWPLWASESLWRTGHMVQPWPPRNRAARDVDSFLSTHIGQR